MKRAGIFAVVLIGVVLAAIVAVRQYDRNVKDRAAPALSRTSLKNMAYRSEDTDSGWIELTDGRFEDARAHLWVTLLDTVAWGDVDGDGHPEAAVVVATNTGGSGVFHNLAVVADVGGRPVNLAVAELGDRIKLNALTIDNEAIFVDMVTHGPGDPMCCPTRRVTRVYGYRDGELYLIEQIPPEMELSE
jgi:hypothetical protein